MPELTPRIILRMGSHSEKEYIEKVAKFLDGMIVGANLVESTPGATASLLVKLAGAKANLPVFVDPMTYAFGCYIDPDTGKLRTDLAWIKSEQIKKKQKIIDYKRSYKGLAKNLGDVFEAALNRNSAISLSDFGTEPQIRSACQVVIDYQLNRIPNVFRADDDYKHFADSVPQPAAVFAPYFYIEPTNVGGWTDLTLRLAAATAQIKCPLPVHAVVCADVSALKDANFLARIKQALPDTGVKGVWLWFSKFLEDRADEQSLRAFRELVSTLATRIEVYNMHGGFFSLALCKHGLSGVSHGVGYGEQKDVVPVIGQSTPMVRYYLPPVHKKLGVPDIERCFKSLGIITPEDFHNKICSCVVCKGVLTNGLGGFSAFGDMHYSTPKSKRLAQTPATAKRCRYHFLLNRIMERDLIDKSSLQEIIKSLGAANSTWSNQPTVGSDSVHLAVWGKVLA